MKWSAVFAMVLLIGLGAWLVYVPKQAIYRPEAREDAVLREYVLNQRKGWIEVFQIDDETHEFRFIGRSGSASEPVTEEAMRRVLGDAEVDLLIHDSGNPLFQLFNITSWFSMVWVAIGLGGQVVFSCRFLIQWIVSEREKKSVIPEIFWWFSFVGGVCLFTYFVWRQDIVGVLGQSTGVVIYARNLRLIRKEKRRAASRVAQDQSPASRVEPKSEREPARS